MKEFIEEVENLEEAMRREIGSCVLMWLCIDKYKGDEEVRRMVYKTQADNIAEKLRVMRRMVERVKKYAETIGLEPAEVADSLSVLVLGLEWLEEEKKKYSIEKEKRT